MELGTDAARSPSDGPDSPTHDVGPSNGPLSIPHSTNHTSLIQGDNSASMPTSQALPICQGPSHGGSYMDKGTFHIRIGLPPHIVSGTISLLPSLFARACSMSDVHDLEAVLVRLTYS